MRHLVLAIALTGALLACGKSGGGMDSAAAGAEGVGGAITSVVPSEEEWEVLRSLSPATLPGARTDVSNALADSPEAATWGQSLFFDLGLSGKLLDADNDGGPNSLGKKGQAGRVSCAGCHMPDADFSDIRSTFQEISLGAGWTHRRSPSLLDIGQASIVMWGGRHSTLWSQPFGPFENPLEMNSSRLFVAQEVARRYAAQYEAIFGAGSLSGLLDATRFPQLTNDTTGCSLTQDVARPRALPPDPLYACKGTPGDGAEYDNLPAADKALVTRVVANVGKALAAYQRKLSCGPGRFDAWVAGDAAALSEAEQRGAMLFIGKAKCVSCHSGPFLSDQAFHNVGLKVVPTKEGIFNGDDAGAHRDLAAARADEVGILGPYSDGNDDRLPSDIGDGFVGAFRTPTLRCVSRRPTFMHTGTMRSLDQVVAFFSKGGDTDGFPGVSELTTLSLAREELAALVSFMRTLDGPGPASSLKEH